jgi:hypothetical protein
MKMDDAKSGKGRLLHNCSAFLSHCAVDERDGGACPLVYEL